jgi:nitroimidazol reductase NimA-like FMN-containing flavoprotein (pyridoxamine 5'-phosphate oxidase superfamily)
MNEIYETKNQANDVITPTPRTTLKRIAVRGSFDRATIHRILDEALVCHVSVALDGKPASIPMAYARMGDRLIVHGSTANRVMRALRDGAEACVVVTLVDGLVLARSAFHHSVNYRCVVLYAKAVELTDPVEKMKALEALVEHVVPGRWRDVRIPSDKEIVRTLMLALPIVEASAKVRDGGPLDDQADYGLPIWAGTIPLRTVPDAPVVDPLETEARPVPAYATAYRRA